MEQNDFVIDLESETENNEDYRRVLVTGSNSQLVVMNIKVGEEIGEEVHEETDQLIRIESGLAEAVLDGESHELPEGFAIFVTAGTRHNIINTSPDHPLKLYTLYSPPEHKAGTVQHEKPEDMEVAE